MADTKKEGKEIDEVEDKKSSLLDDYNLIPGVKGSHLAMVLWQIDNAIGKALYEAASKGEVPKIDLNAIISSILDDIVHYRDNVYKDIVEKGMAKLKKESSKEKARGQVRLALASIDSLLANKDKLRAMAKNVLQREGLLKEMSPAQVRKLKNIAKAQKIAEQKELHEKAEALRQRLLEDKDLVLTEEEEAILNSVGESDMTEGETTTENEEFNPEEEEIKEYNKWDSDAMYDNPFSQVHSLINAFLKGNPVYVFNEKTQKAEPQGTLFLGFPAYEKSSKVYKIIQRILATYPNKPGIAPSYDAYVKALEDNIPTHPFLQGVVEKLRAQQSEAFKAAFVKTFTKQYNNTRIIVPDVNRNLRILSVDYENSTLLQKEKWIGKFNANADKNLVYKDEGMGDIVLKPSLMAKLRANQKELLELLEYYKRPMTSPEVSALVQVKSNITKDEINAIKEKIQARMITLMKDSYDSIGVELEDAYYREIEKDVVKHIGTVQKYALGSVIGDARLGLKPVGNLATNSLYQDSSFSRLARENSAYLPDQVNPTAKDIEGKSIYNYSETKNLVAAFNKNKNNIEWLRATFADPYRNIDNIISIDDYKAYKTFLEGLVKSDDGEYILRNSLLFAEGLEYMTFNGSKFITDKGTEAFTADNLSDVGMVTSMLNAFINGGESKLGGTRMGYIPFFTMSDKKVPMFFKVPLYNFSIHLFDTNLFESLEKLGEKRLAEDDATYEMLRQQREYLFESMIHPELNRILALSKPGALEQINIEGYEIENMRFFNTPFLNSIVFNEELRKKYDIAEDLEFTKEVIKQSKDKNGNDIALKIKVINPDALVHPGVKRLMVDKTVDYLKGRTSTFKNLLLEEKIIHTPEGADNVYFANKSIDSKGIERYYDSAGDNLFPSVAAARAQKDNWGESTSEMTDTIINFIINTATGYGNLQQLLIGDPIQFAKSKKSLKLAQQIAEKEQEYLRAKKKADKAAIALELDELRAKYDQAFATEDAFETNDNFGKRLGGDNASGSLLAFKPTDTHTNVVVVKDAEASSELLDYYRKIWEAEMLKPNMSDEEKQKVNKEIDKLVDAYRNINTADGQVLTTLEEWAKVKVADGVITDEQAKAILEADNDGKLDISQYATILGSDKLVYSGNMMRDGINSRMYIKSSDFPLSKTFTNGLPIAKLYETMKNKKIDRILFESAVKVGLPKTVPAIFNGKGEVALEGVKLEEHLLTIPREHLKKQVNVPFDENKTDISDSTQKAKLVFQNIMDVDGFVHPLTGEKVTGRELYEGYTYDSKTTDTSTEPPTTTTTKKRAKGYIDIFNDYFKAKHLKLKDELYTNGELNFKKLHKVLRDEAIRRGYSDNEMVFLRLNENEDSFDFPIWMASNLSKIEALLVSLTDNNVRKRKRRGKSAVLVTDALIDITEGSNIKWLDKNRKGKLLPMREDPNTGEMLPAEIVISFPFKDNFGNPLDINDYLNEDGSINTSKLPEELLEMMAFRIPNQGHNSNALVKVVGFLPPSVDNVTFISKDFVTQMGSDFDVDKLYSDITSTVYDHRTGQLTKLTPEHIEAAEHKAKLDKVFKKRQLLNKEAKSLSKTLDALNKQKENNESVNEEELNETLRKYKNVKKDIAYANKHIEALKLKSADFPTIPYFKGIDKLRTKVLENQMLDFQKAIYKNPATEVQAQRIQPIDNSALVNIKENLVPSLYKQDYSKDWSPLDAMYQMHKYKGGRSGKTGVSSFSSDVVFNAVLQTVRLPIHFSFQNSKTGEIHTTRYTLFGKKNNSLNQSKTIDGTQYKSDIIQAFQSISVDNEKLQVMFKLNINDHTFDFIRAAIQGGFNESEILHFINHPAIRLYVDGLYKEIVPSVRPKSSGETFKNLEILAGKLDEDSYKYAIDLYNANPEEYKKKHLHSVENEAIFHMFEVLSSRGKQLKELHGLLNIDSSGLGLSFFYGLELEKAIDNLVINDFFSNTSELFLTSIGALEQETSIKEIQSRIESAKNEIEKNELFTNLKSQKNKILTEIKENGFVKSGNNWYKPNTISGSVFFYALKLNNYVLDYILPYSNTKFKDVIEDLFQLILTKDIDFFIGYDQLIINSSNTLESILKILSENRSFFKNTYNDNINLISPKYIGKVKQDIMKEFNAFLYTAISKSDAFEARKRLFDNNKLVQDIVALKDSRRLANNTLFNRIIFKKIETNHSIEKVIIEKDVDSINLVSVTPLNLVFDAFSSDMFGEENSYLHDMIAILEHADEDIRNIGHRLVEHQLLTSGIQRGTQFIRHIPVSYLKNLGLFHDVTNRIVNDENIFDNFFEQYIQHFPQIVYSKGLELEIRKINGKYFKKNDNIFVSKNTPEEYESKNRCLNYVSIIENRRLVLFKRNRTNNEMFEKIPILGSSLIREFNINVNDIARSILH